MISFKKLKTYVVVYSKDTRRFFAIGGDCKISYSEDIYYHIEEEDYNTILSLVGALPEIDPGELEEKELETTKDKAFDELIKIKEEKEAKEEKEEKEAKEAKEDNN